MSQITKPIALDETLQDVVSAIQGITQGGMIVSTGTVGSATQPVYIDGGVPTASDQAFIVTGKTFYVDGATGSDSNDGSQAHPFATIQKAVNSCGTIENNPASRNWGSPGDRIYINTASTYAPFRVIGKRIDFNAIDSSAGALKISTSSATLFGAIDICWGSYVCFNCAVDITYNNTSRGAISANDCYCRFAQNVTVVSSGNGVAASMRGHIYAASGTWNITCGTGGSQACIMAADGGDIAIDGTVYCNGGRNGVYANEGGAIHLGAAVIASGMSTGLYANRGGLIDIQGTLTNNATVKEEIYKYSFINGRQVIITGTPTSPATGLSFQSGGFAVKKTGNVVTFRVVLEIGSGYTPSTSTTLFQVPFTPESQFCASVAIGKGGVGYEYALAYVNAGKNVTLASTSGITKAVQGNVIQVYGTYMTND